MVLEVGAYALDKLVAVHGLQHLVHHLRELGLGTVIALAHCVVIAVHGDTLYYYGGVKVVCILPVCGSEAEHRGVAGGCHKLWVPHHVTVGSRQLDGLGQLVIHGGQGVIGLLLTGGPGSGIERVAVGISQHTFLKGQRKVDAAAFLEQVDKVLLVLEGVVYVAEARVVQKLPGHVLVEDDIHVVVVIFPAAEELLVYARALRLNQRAADGEGVPLDGGNDDDGRLLRPGHLDGVAVDEIKAVELIGEAVDVHRAQVKGLALWRLVAAEENGDAAVLCRGRQQVVAPEILGGQSDVQLDKLKAEVVRYSYPGFAAASAGRQREQHHRRKQQRQYSFHSFSPFQCLFCPGSPHRNAYRMSRSGAHRALQIFVGQLGGVHVVAVLVHDVAVFVEHEDHARIQDQRVAQHVVGADPVAAVVVAEPLVGAVAVDV